MTPSVALLQAYRDLNSEINSGIKRHEKTNRISNAKRIRRCIQRFVDALNQVPEAAEELAKRAELIERACKAGTKYSKAKEAAIEALSHQHQKRLKLRLILKKIHTAGDPHLLSQIDSLTSELYTPIADNSKLSSSMKKAISQLFNACREIQQEGDLLCVDGCWFLQNLYESASSDQSAESEIAVVTIGSRYGGAYLQLIQDAAESLVRWVEELNLVKKTKSTPKRKAGRKGADPTERYEESRIRREWEESRDAGIHKADFAKDQNMSVKALDRLLDRVKRREKRSDKKR